MSPKGIDHILKKFEYRESAIIAILQEVQEKQNYLPEKDLEYISEKLPIQIGRAHV